METEKLRKKPFPYGKLLAVIAMLITVAAFAPYLLTARYALPFADDFWFYNDSVAYGGSALSNAMSTTVGFWFTWQGTYTSTFFNCLFSPLQFADYALVIRLELIAQLLLAAASTALLFWSICGYCGLEKRYAAYFCCLFALPLLSSAAYTGAYLWYTGVMAYLLPAVALLLSLSLLLIARERGKPAVCVYIYIYCPALWPFLRPAECFRPPVSAPD